jgi:hypothetical protein
MKERFSIFLAIFVFFVLVVLAILMVKSNYPLYALIVGILLGLMIFGIYISKKIGW